MSAALATNDAPPRIPTSMSQQFVTFWLEGEVFGLPLSEVQEIIRMPRIVRVPLAAESLAGIANLRGAVLPIISLRRIFGMADTPMTDATRVVVVNRGSLAGYVIDRMASVITTEPHEIEPIESVSGTIHTELLQAMIKRDEGTIMLLSLPSLGERPAAERPGGKNLDLHRASAVLASAGQPGPGQASAGVIQLVSFEVAEQEYAFPIEDVQEIVQVPPKIIGVPRSDPHVMGVMNLRNRLLPLVSLRRMFDMPQAPLAENNRIVVVSFAGPAGAARVSVGIIMDAVNEVLRVSRSLVEPVPALLANQSGGSELEAICRLDGGRLVTILAVEKMFPARVREQLLDAAQSAQTADAPVSETHAVEASDEEQFVIFRLGGEEFGVPIAAVQEIVRVPEQLTKVPKTPDFISGVVNLRGVVLPVVDQRRRFGLPEMIRNDRQRIMVLMVGAVRTGFVVDSVAEVLKIPRSTIGPAPHLSEEQKKLIDRVANLEHQKRMLMLMRPERLLSVEEQGAVTGLSAMLKVLVVDDSALMRRQLRQILEDTGEMEVETARNGREALERLGEFAAAVVTLDVNMPEMDGLTCLAHIMRDSPRPVVMVSSITTEGSQAAIKALALGAVEVVPKPDGTVSVGLERMREELVVKVRAAAQSRPRRALRLREAMRQEREAADGRRKAASLRANGRHAPSVTLIGVSTGGPRALEDILPELPGDYPQPVLVAQHMPAAFTESFARRLNTICALTVVEVTRVAPLTEGHIYIGRGDRDLVLERQLGRLVVNSVPSGPTPWHPSVDRLVRSVLGLLPAPRLIGVQLTGMGDDGAEAMAKLRADGGRTIAESQETAAVFGMPAELISRGGATRVLPCHVIAEQLVAWAQGEEE